MGQDSLKTWQHRPPHSLRERERERQKGRQTDRTGQTERKKRKKTKKERYVDPGGQPPSTLKDVAGMPDVLASYLLLLSPLYRPTFALRWAGARLSGVSLKIRSWKHRQFLRYVALRVEESQASQVKSTSTTSTPYLHHSAAQQ